MNISHTTKKAGAVMILALLCFIPTVFVMSVINDREIRSREVRDSVASEWGNRQDFLGPIMVVPYTEVRLIDGKRTEFYKHLYIFPETEDLQIELAPSSKTRGIFRVPVYTVAINGDATFIVPKAETLAEFGTNFDFKKTTIAFPIADVRSITPESRVMIDGSESALLQGGGLPAMEKTFSGVHVRTNREGKPSIRVEFGLTMNGSADFAFLPSGSVTHVEAKSSWTAPSFSGAYLPQSSTMSTEGFNASWTISGLGRAFPSIMNTDSFNYELVRQSLSTIALYDGVDQYQLVSRTIKYAILFIILTFMAFFFVEVLHKLRVHPIQYAFVGAGLALFYLLLLALSEHVQFVYAYVIAASMTTSMVALYALVILHARRFAGIIGGLLIALYAYLYFVLRSEDYALLLGTILLFGALALVMYITRRVDWYGIEGGS